MLPFFRWFLRSWTLLIVCLFRSISLDPVGTLDDEASEAPLVLAERKADALRKTLSKTRDALGRLHDIMLPEDDTPADLAGLVEAFQDDDAIRKYSFAQTERGVSSFLAVALANNIEADFETVTTRYPRDSDGKAKSTRRFSKAAEKLSKQFSALIRAREAEKAKDAAAKSSAPSESGAP